MKLLFASFFFSESLKYAHQLYKKLIKKLISELCGMDRSLGKGRAAAVFIQTGNTTWDVSVGKQSLTEW